MSYPSCLRRNWIELLLRAHLPHHKRVVYCGCQDVAALVREYYTSHLQTDEIERNSDPKGMKKRQEDGTGEQTGERRWIYIYIYIGLPHCHHQRYDHYHYEQGFDGGGCCRSPSIRTHDRHSHSQTCLPKVSRRTPPANKQMSQWTNLEYVFCSFFFFFCRELLVFVEEYLFSLIAQNSLGCTGYCIPHL